MVTLGSSFQATSSLRCEFTRCSEQISTLCRRSRVIKRSPSSATLDGRPTKIEVLPFTWERPVLGISVKSSVVLATDFFALWEPQAPRPASSHVAKGEPLHDFHDRS